MVQEQFLWSSLRTVWLWGQVPVCSTVGGRGVCSLPAGKSGRTGLLPPCPESRTSLFL